ncbi:MAG: hypothetical protein KDD67_06535 [Ignavibacteriae bacterium]|nr:hypothetical protein [Ignavibacteriota bacterium]MCB9215593.1 hypothetical protein [Ignavibacteria bacterium]
MYQVLLFTHSWLRWLVLLALLFAIYRAWFGWKSGGKFGVVDERARYVAMRLVHLQFLLGLLLYGFSPITRHFLTNFSTAVHMREVRFFGMEHVAVMVVSVVLITVGAKQVKREEDQKKKFRKMAIWYGIATLLILSSIPWSFSPLTSRPLFRS